jgi:hypothetical protein
MSQRLKLALLVTLLTIGAPVWYMRQKVEHQVFAMEYTAGGEPAAVETWSLPLPAGFEAVYWKSTPHSGQDGIRIFQRDQR